MDEQTRLKNAPLGALTAPSLINLEDAKLGALGVSGAVHTVSGAMHQIKSGSISQNTGLMNPVIEPYLILKKKKKYYPPDENIGNNSGLPSNVCVTLSNISGYVKVSAIHLEISGALDEELSEIDSLLKGGVIL